MFEVKDNFLPEKEYINIYTLLADEYFPWYFNNYKTVPHTKELFDYQFTHIFYKDNEILSPFFKGLKPLIDKLNSRTLVRIKANLNPITQELIKSKSHTDQDFECKVAIYYLNTNNGYTMLEDKKVESKANRIVLFDSSIFHYGTNSTNCNNRMVINFNYF